MLPSQELTSALISLIVGTLLGSELTRWLYRPNVVIRYEDVDPLHTEDGVHWSIKVANLGRTVATDCKATITIDELQQSDLLDTQEADAKEILPDYREENADLSFPRPQQIGRKFFRPINGASLAWACLGNPPELSINPGITEVLDVFKIQQCSRGPYVCLPTEAGWRRLRARIKARPLSGRIFICPSNEFPTLIMFRLSFDEAGQSRFEVTKPTILKRLQRYFFSRQYYFG